MEMIIEMGMPNLYCFGPFWSFMESTKAKHIRGEFSKDKFYQTWLLKGVVVDYNADKIKKQSSIRLLNLQQLSQKNFFFYC